MIYATTVHACRGAKNSTEDLEDLINLVPFEGGASASLRDAVPYIYFYSSIHYI